MPLATATSVRPPGLDCLEGGCCSLIAILEGRLSSVKVLLCATSQSALEVEMSCMVEAHQLTLGVRTTFFFSSALAFSLAFALGSSPDRKEGLTGGKNWLARVARGRSLILKGEWNLARSTTPVGNHQLLVIEAKALDNLVVLATNAVIQVAEVSSLLEIDEEGQKS